MKRGWMLGAVAALTLWTGAALACPICGAKEVDAHLFRGSMSVLFLVGVGLLGVIAVFAREIRRIQRGANRSEGTPNAGE